LGTLRATYFRPGYVNQVTAAKGFHFDVAIDAENTFLDGGLQYQIRIAISL
jgi:hypothetical protein